MEATSAVLIVVEMERSQGISAKLCVQTPLQITVSVLYIVGADLTTTVTICNLWDMRLIKSLRYHGATCPLLEDSKMRAAGG